MVFFDSTIAPDAGAVLKQVTQLPSKARFIAAQYLAYFDGALWRELARSANARAKQLADGLLSIEGFSLHAPCDANMVLLEGPRARMATLRERCAFHFWNREQTVGRLVCSFDHTSEDTEEFLAHASAL